jgi:PAS domain S-box-containing protein
VLYVGDADDSGSIEAMLARRTDRFEVVTAAGVNEALARIDGGRVDCVVSERAVPGGDGVELLRTIREANDDLPFVLLGEGGSASNVDEAFDAGATDYVPDCAEPERSTLLANRIEAVVERNRAKRATETRTRRLETVISNLPGVVYRCRNEPEWPMEFVRGECEELTGYPAAALEDGDVVWGTDLIHPDDREQMWETVQDALAADDSFEVTYRIVARDGAVRWMWERGRGVYDDGEVVALEGFITDITERKTHERELKRLKEEYRVVFEHARDSLFLIDAEPAASDGDEPAFVIRQINPANEATLGLTNEEVQGRTHAELFGGELGETLAANYRRCFETGEVVSYEEEIPVEGGVRLFETTLSPVVVDGEVRQIVGVAHDVTAREKRERQLASLHEASRDLMAAGSPSAVARITVEASETILSFANTAVRLVDDDEELLRVAGATEESVSRAGDRPDYRVDGDAPAARAYRTGESVVVDDLERVGDRYDRGSLRSAAYVPLGGDGVVTVADTEPAAFDDADVEIVRLLAGLAATALARIQSRANLEAQNERLEEFASIVSHDLRNPLNVAEGRVTLAREECDSDHLVAAADAHGRMRGLIEDLLALAREGADVTDAEPVDLGRLFETEWVHVDTGDATIDVRTERVVQADRTQLRRLLANLVRNAVEHGSTSPRSHAREDSLEHGSTGSGTESESEADDAGVRIEIGDLDGGFYVEDDGPGIPEDRRERVFEAGYTTGDAGTGFGLAIVGRIADAHGWTVSLSDGADGGARFEFRGVEIEAG